jgi:hypothetical protein
VHHGTGDGHALHHSARKAADKLVGTVRQFKAIEQLRGALRSFAGTNAKVCSVKEQNLARSQRKIQIWTLCNHSYLPFGSGLILPNIVFANPGSAAGGPHTRGQDADRR